MSSTNYTGHVYLSTACLHAREPGMEELHEHCKAKTNLEGEEKKPGTCKWCATPCVCTCHTQEPGRQSA